MQVRNPNPLVPVAPAALNTSQPSENSQRESRFASLLRQNQAPAAAPVQACRATPKHGDTGAASSAQDTGTAPEPETPAAPNGTAHPANRLRPKGADKSTPAKAAETATRPFTNATNATDETAPKESAESLQAGGDTAANPAPGPWLASLQHPGDPAVPAAGKTARSGNGIEGADSLVRDTATTGKAGDSAAAATATAGHDLKWQAEARKAARGDSETNASARPVPAGADTLAALQAAGPGHDELRGQQRVHGDNAPAPTAPGMAGFDLGAAARSRDLPAPATVALPTPLAAPEFAQALGVQMSVLARDGVQHAELQLNPPDMGPVSVQIVIDGTTAQVDFGADMAATRHAIEAGLPELAGALRDAGFTLTGGGVSQHSRGRGEPGTGEQAPGRLMHRAVDAGPDSGAPRAPRRTVRAGGVDLYA